jgi:hypothetical protein
MAILNHFCHEARLCHDHDGKGEISGVVSPNITRITVNAPLFPSRTQRESTSPLDGEP